MARSKRRDWVRHGGAHGKGKSKPVPKITKPREVVIDPEVEYLKAVDSLEKEIAESKEHPTLPEKQIRLAQIHRDQVFAMGFNPELATHGFFVAGPNRLEHSKKARAIWEAADKLEKQAQKHPQKRV